MLLSSNVVVSDNAVHGRHEIRMRIKPGIQKRHDDARARIFRIRIEP
jgi:hypothetical protein